LVLMAGMVACDEETTADTGSGASTSTSTNSGGSGATGGNGTGGSGAGATGGGGSGTGGVMMGTNANCDPPSGTPGNLTTEEITNGLQYPVLVTSAWGDGERMYVAEKHGSIYLLKDGNRSLFLDIENRVQSGGAQDERGLLGLAFHPDYVNNGRFFVHYSNGPGGPGASSGDTVIEEYQRNPNDPDEADSTPVQLIYTTDQPASNHNGGAIAFSPVDGYLWIGLGDGGDRDDSFGNSQNKDTPLAALLRIDVDGQAPYEVPAGNIGDGLDLIHDWGLRNPYRWSFDICTGDRYIGDVGQGCFEEISVAAANAGNVNWGWNIMEGNACFESNMDCGNPPTGCNMDGITLPAVDIPRNMANSITGGHVYRGSAIPWLRGAYLYGDFAQGNLWMLRWENGTVTEGPTDITSQLTGVRFPSGWGLDNDGELYVVEYDFVDGNDGKVFRIVAE
jgi:glucose/arabinose dehydrogenase